VIALQAGDLCAAGSDAFADYRDQLISWDEYHQEVEHFGQQIGLPTEAKKFVARTKELLDSVADATDRSFPVNQSVRIVNGEPMIAKLKKDLEPPENRTWRAEVQSRMPLLEILDVLVDTDNWLAWSRLFGPISENDPKRADSRARSLSTTFCYGCDLGPSQTERCLKGFDRRQLAFANQRHVTEEKLDEAITKVINAYNKFALPRPWGTGKSASADGTKWDLYEDNLLSEYHIRYGGYGGIGSPSACSGDM
jgi:hypothetical protein